MAASVTQIRACIFDVDGTLINSEDIYSEIYNKILHEYGKPDYPWSIKAVQQSRGTSVRP
jgi:pseudouridine-5'-monophosphatase